MTRSAFSSIGRRARSAVALVGTLLAFNVAMPSIAEAQRVRATLTDITSNSDRIVSYRHQEHLWQTADGSYHLIVNRGTLTPGPGLSLFSSHDGGTTWQYQLAFAGTDEDSVSDGQLAGSDLSVVYQTSDGSVVFQVLRYDSGARTWGVAVSETAFASTQFAAINPAIGVDAQGTVWCAFVRRQRETNDVDIRLFARPAGGAGWADTGVVFGPTDRLSIERSARPVPVPGGMGMVFTVREMTYWAVRGDTQPLGASWAISTILAGTPAFRTTDPYASHFSVVADDQGNTHLSTIDDNSVLNFRRDAVSGLWNPVGLLLSAGKKVGFSQNTIANGRLAVAWSAQRGFGSAVLSSDQGVSYSQAATLVLPADAPGVSYGQARVEMATRSTGPLIVMQQYTDNGTTRLMLFTLPAP